MEMKDTRSGFGAGLTELGKAILMLWHYALTSQVR